MGKVPCPYCHNDAVLVTGEIIYPHRPDLHEKRFWHCEPCGAYVGTHTNSRKHAPLGRLANAELRSLKVRVHAAFDPLWRSGQMTRNEAYSRLAEDMGIPKSECHIGMFSVDRCRTALNCKRIMEKEADDD